MRSFPKFYLNRGNEETRGNETGNEQETKRYFLCKIGNGPETRNGNERALFLSLRFHPEHGRKDRRDDQTTCLIPGDFFTRGEWRGPLAGKVPALRWTGA
jgi:hypothetical protein